jgi:hypothetical protein
MGRPVKSGKGSTICLILLFVICFYYGIKKIINTPFNC